MSDDGDYDPDAGVPPWVNIVVPIMSVILFIIVVVLLYRTEKEIPRDTLVDWASRTPVLNKWLLSDDQVTIENKRARNRNNSSRAVKETEKSPLNAVYNLDRYDSISTIKTLCTTGSASLYSGRQLYASRGTLISFETNV